MQFTSRTSSFPPAFPARDRRPSTTSASAAAAVSASNSAASSSSTTPSPPAGPAAAPAMPTPAVHAQPNIHSITLSLQKLSGSRNWLRRLKGPTWNPKLLTLTPSAGVQYVHPTETTVPTCYNLVPGGALLAPHSDQLNYARAHLFVLVVVPVQSPDPRPKRRTLYFAASTADDAASAVAYATEVSYRNMGGLFAPYVAPLLTAWGNNRRLPPAAAVAAAQSLGHSISLAGFEHAFRAAVHAPIRPAVSSEEFVAVMMHIAGSTLSQLLSLPSAPFTLDARQLAPVLGTTEDAVQAALRSVDADRCSSSLLVYLLFRPDNSVLDPARASSAHDLTQPLNQYIVSSSHNTYLTGDQLRSDASAHMYRVALERRCRCLELDMWDGDDGEPVITHGHTMTSEETLEHVLHVIIEHAFAHGTDMPLILSLENHLTMPQQKIAAEMFSRVLGDALLPADPTGHDLEKLPSPDMLRGRVLLKAKTGTSLVRAEAQKKAVVPSDVAEDSSEDDSTSTPSSGELTGARRRASSPGKKPTRKRKKGHRAVARELADLVFLAGGNRKTVVELWKRGISGSHEFVCASCVSLDERRLMASYARSDAEVIRGYNAHALTRVYPKGLRMDSSNFTPTLGHALGCQLVALNWQKSDTGLAVNEARFVANDGLGYVLSRSVREPAMPGTLSMTILSGFLMPRAKLGNLKPDIGDPYVVIKLFDAVFDQEDDYSSYRYATDPARNDSFMPVWNEAIEIPVVNRALAVLVVKVYDRDRSSGDDLLGYSSVAISMIRDGLRCFPLKSKKGDPLTIPGTELVPSILVRLGWDGN